jgi:hypothetical protein
MNRQVIDLGTARDEEPQMVHSWEYMYIGECDGDVTMRLGSQRLSSPINPDEFGKITNISDIEWIYITNTAQSGKQLVIYFKEKRWMMY